jgi:carbon starvation protein CstA
MLRDIMNGDVPFLPNMFSVWNMTNQQLIIIALFSVAAAYVMVRVASGVRVITIPICFSSFFIAAMFSNWFFKDFHITAISEIQKTLIFTVVGHIVVSFVLLLGFRTENIR